MSARYEVYEDRHIIGDYLAKQLDKAGESDSANVFRDWSKEPSGLFAQCWVSCVGRKS